VVDSDGALEVPGREQGHDGVQGDEGFPKVVTASSITSREGGEGRLESSMAQVSFECGDTSPTYL
jgi:hypothetical protein